MKSKTGGGFKKTPKPVSAEEFISGAPSVARPGDGGAGYVRVNTQITNGQYEELRHLSFGQRKSQAELIREALDYWLPTQREGR